MSALPTCPACRTPLPGDAPGGLCPQCLWDSLAGSDSAASRRAGARGATTIRYFGDYELVGEIAAGGMGVVYYAHQVSLNRNVALKMIRSGALATPAEVQRFRTEAEAAANLDHPNIVPIYEIGEHEGQHYFSMKLVEGGNLAERISNLKSQISNQEAARLIATLARAVHHAHQRGVLHRDLKPSNVLLDDQGEPHLTDFGLAKLARQNQDFTQTLAVLGTPHYMAPEQAAGKARELTTAADIYSLGAMLYELLAGRPPFRGESAWEVLRQAQTLEPVPPRRLNSAVDRDLEIICLKCLEKDPRRRYDTAEELAKDLNHWLAGEPIQARPTKLPERALKWARRNPALATLIVLAHLLFAAGLGGVLWQWRRAENHATRAKAHQRQAEAQALRSQQVAQFMREMLSGVDPSVALGRDATLLREILDRAAERMGTELSNHPEVAAELRYTIGNVYHALGQYEKAESIQREALAQARCLWGDQDTNVVESIRALANTLWRQGLNGQPSRLNEAERLLREALELYRRLVPEENLYAALLLNDLSVVLRDLARPDESETFCRQALAIRQRLLGMQHLAVADSLHDLALVLDRPGGRSEAEAVCRRAHGLRQKLLGDEHPDVANSLADLAGILRHQDRLAEAEVAFRQVVEMRLKLLGREHPTTASSVRDLAECLRAQGRSAEGEAFAREAVALRRKRLGDEHPEVAAALGELVLCLSDQGKLAEAEAAAREALAIQRKQLLSGHSGTFAAVKWLGDILRAQGKLGEAEALVREALALHRQQSGNPDRALLELLESLASALEAQNRLAEAEAVWREELAVERELSGEEHPWVANSLMQLSDVLQRQGKHEEAEAAVRQALAIRRKVWGDHSPQVADALRWLGVVLENQGKLAEAESVLRERVAIERKLGRNDAAFASLLATLTRVLMLRGHFAEAESFARECLAIREKLLPDNWLTFNARSMLGGILLGQKKFAEAEALLLAGYEGMKQREDKIPPTGKARLFEALERIVQLYMDWNKTVQAAEWEKRLAEHEQPAKPQ
jgi:tetratricopeptide (TPR) repeat protein/tRNA A-37 threonylcarbamoyl transferase component Bud32